MEGLIMAGQLILGLSILIVLHEAGHFFAARAFGIRVEKFYLFFDAWGVKLFSFTYKGCEYGIGWLPLGGYVKISGMIDESMDTDQMAGPPQPWEFRSKPAWQRLIVMLGGVTVNIVLGIFIFWMLTVRFGDSYIPNASVKNGVVPGIIGKKIGLQPGDKVVTINGKKITRYEEISSSKVLLGNSKLGIIRNGKNLTIPVPGDVLELVSDYKIQEFVNPRYTSKVDSFLSGSGAKKAGIKEGDKIIAINGKPVGYQDQIRDNVTGMKNKTVRMSVLRNSDTLQYDVKVNEKGQIGVAPDFDEISIVTIEYGFFEALPIGATKAWQSFMDNARGLGKVLTGQVKPGKAFTGPVGIAKMFGAKVDWVRFWSLVGLLSMALALMNMLPVPALDGGHSMFLLIEMIKGKPLGDKFMERAQIVGFVLLVALMVFVIGNEVFKEVIGNKMK